MEQDIVDQMHRFALSDKESSGIEISDTDAEPGVLECSLSLIGKIVGEKKASIGGLRTMMGMIWKTGRLFSIRVLDHNLFQFLFQSEEDITKVLKGKAWTFDGQYLLLKEWKKDDIDFKAGEMKIALWVQIHNLPLHWLSAEIGIKVGKLFSSVEDVIAPGTGSSNGRFVKILAEIDISEPLPRGTMLKLGQEQHWIALRYENLPLFCFYCGRIRHSERTCDTKKTDVQRNVIKTGQYGDWIRAANGGFGGWRDVRTPSHLGFNSNSESSQMYKQGREEGSPGAEGDGGKSKGSVGEKPVEVEVVADKANPVVISEGPRVVVSTKNVVGNPTNVGPMSVTPMDLDSLKGHRVVEDNLVDVVVQSSHHSSGSTKPKRTFVKVARSKNMEDQTKNKNVVSTLVLSGDHAGVSVLKRKMPVLDSNNNEVLESVFKKQKK
ncbi:Unknown protein [Striga hermonthica]|uniref:CCHC-type domain-containing protein n=1 Tax=Striga hermonthica TaxID=68872 RepID=A0A9N7P114_STRHE|nr:Unknown protein [Striga hermonthica]